MSAERIDCTAALFDAVRCQSSAERIQNIAAVTFSSVSEVWGGQSAVFVLLQLRGALTEVLPACEQAEG